MSAETKSRKACEREAKRVLAGREQERQSTSAAQEIARNKAVINGKIAGLQEERNQFLRETVALRKTNPEAAKIMIARGASLDAAILQAQKSLAMANSLGIEHRIEDLIEESYSLIRRLKTDPVRFRTAKELKKLKEESQLRDIMHDLAEKSRQAEWDIYTGGMVGGVGSTFEADVLAAERQAEIDEIDD